MNILFILFNNICKSYLDRIIFGECTTRSSMTTDIRERETPCADIPAAIVVPLIVVPASVAYQLDIPATRDVLCFVILVVVVLLCLFSFFFLLFFFFFVLREDMTTPLYSRVVLCLLS